MEKNDVVVGKPSVKRTAVKVGAVIGIFVSLIFAGSGMYPHIVQDVDTRSWHVIFEGNLASAAEADPGSGAGGILEVFFINHTATPATAYDENTSATLESWCTAAGLGYASADDFNVELAHTVTFDVVVRVRGNATMCERAGDWFDADLKVEWTSSDLGISADTDMTGVVSYNNTAAPYLWMNFYDTNGGSGFTLSKDETNTISSIKFSAYY